MAFTTQGTLLLKIKNGDETSWDEFYNIYRKLIILKGGDLRLNKDEQEELVQLVMLAFFNASKTFVYDKSKGRFRDYFKTIIRNKAIDIMRKRDKDTISIDENEFLVNSISSEDDVHWDNEWQKLILEQAFQELKLRCDPTTLQSFDLFVNKNLPAKEVAKLLDIKPNAVYQHKSRIEEMLRSIVKELDV